MIDDKIICMHGGLSPELSQMEQIANIARPCDVPDTGLLCDILWADPDPSITVRPVVTLYIYIYTYCILIAYSRIVLLLLQCRDGEKMIAACPSPLAETWFVNFSVDTIWIWW